MGDASTGWFSSLIFSNREQQWRVLRIEKCSTTNSEEHVIAEVSQGPETVSVLFSMRESKQNVLIVICISRRKNERGLFEKTTAKQSCKPEGKEKQPQIYYLRCNIVSMTLAHLEIGIVKYLPLDTSTKVPDSHQKAAGGLREAAPVPAWSSQAGLTERVLPIPHPCLVLAGAHRATALSAAHVLTPPAPVPGQKSTLKTGL